MSRFRFTVPRDNHTYHMRNMTVPDAIAEAKNEAEWRGCAVQVTADPPLSSFPVTFIAGPSGLVTSHREDA